VAIVDRTSRRATPVLMVITTAAAVSASISNEPESFLIRASAVNRQNRGVTTGVDCKAATHRRIAELP
jgi:hypothetical protein